MSNDQRSHRNGARDKMIDQIVQDIMSPANTKKTDVDVCLRKGTEINKAVQGVLQVHEADFLLKSKDEKFNQVFKLYVEAAHGMRLDKDELLFLFAFSSAKILTDQL